MDNPATFFESGQVTCDCCGKLNDLGTSEALYMAEESTRCVHCGFLFIRHKNRQMDKMMEMINTDPEWGNLIRTGRHTELKKRLDELVPIEDFARDAD